MKNTTLKEFRQKLIATGSYETAPEHRAAKRAKPGFWTTFKYSLGVFKVFPMCAIYENLRMLNTEKWAEFCFATVTHAESLGMKVILEGWRQRQDYKGPVVYLCNHMSSTETIMLPPVLLTYGMFNVVAKMSLAHLPLLARAAEHMGMIGINRKSPREDFMRLMEIGVKKIKEGNSFLIFPQGTREKVFSRKKYSSIGAKLAEKAGCPIVPLCIDSRCQMTREKGLLRHVFKDFGPVDTSKDLRLACGPVIPCSKAREMHEAAFDWIAGKLENWGLPVER